MTPFGRFWRSPSTTASSTTTKHAARCAAVRGAARPSSSPWAISAASSGTTGSAFAVHRAWITARPPAAARRAARSAGRGPRLWRSGTPTWCAPTARRGATRAGRRAGGAARRGGGSRLGGPHVWAEVAELAREHEIGSHSIPPVVARMHRQRTRGRGRRLRRRSRLASEFTDRLFPATRTGDCDPRPSRRCAAPVTGSPDRRLGEQPAAVLPARPRRCDMHPDHAGTATARCRQRVSPGA